MARLAAWICLLFCCGGLTFLANIGGGWPAGSVCPTQSHTRTCAHRPPSDGAGTSPRGGAGAQTHLPPATDQGTSILLDDDALLWSSSLAHREQRLP